MSILEKIRNNVLPLLIPSSWIRWLNGNKTALGVIALALWGSIYAVPALCTTATCGLIVEIGLQIKDFLVSIGVDLSTELLELGSILTLVGLTDKIVDHKATKIVIGLFKLIEEPIAKLIAKGDA